jgi:hypothetical protein
LALLARQKNPQPRPERTFSFSASRRRARGVLALITGKLLASGIALPSGLPGGVDIAPRAGTDTSARRKR